MEEGSTEKLSSELKIMAPRHINCSMITQAHATSIHAACIKQIFMVFRLHKLKVNKSPLILVQSTKTSG